MNYDKNELKDTIIKIFNNKKEIARLQKNGKCLIKQTFNIVSCTNKIEKLYFSITHDNHMSEKV